MKFKYFYLIILLISLISLVNAAPPVAIFTANETIGYTYPYVVKFTDSSTGNPTSWNWSYGDGRWFNTTNIFLKDPTYPYAVAGKYNVSLIVTNAEGSNTSTMTNYLNLTSDADSYLKSWLHMNGTNGSIIFSGEEGLAWTTHGDAYITTNTVKYGGASGSFRGSKPYISTISSPALSLGTNDFTIEMWVNVSSSSQWMPLVHKGNNVLTSGWGIYHSSNSGASDAWKFYMGNYASNSTGTFSLPLNTWNHLAIERRSGGNIDVYVNGNRVATASNLSGNYSTTSDLNIGYRPNSYFDGYIDEFRLSNGVARWTSNFTTPYNEYRGVLETVYPDINPASTFRYKTDPGGNAYIDNITPRNRTVQIQNITNTSFVLGSALFNPECGFVSGVRLNTTYYATGMTLISSNIDNVHGIVEFNVSKPSGFSPGVNRASIIDFTLIYSNYTDVHDLSDYFGYGYLINGTTNQVYPIHNFLSTHPTFGDWNFTANFTATNTSFIVGNITTFVSTFNGSYPNRWNWSFGDGEYDFGSNSTVTHLYTTKGLKNVTLTEWLWQNGSINSTKLRTNYINVTGVSPTAIFTSMTTGGPFVPVTVEFIDGSSGFPTSWNWSFGDGNVSNLQFPIHTYEVCGNFDVLLRVENPDGVSWENKTSYVITACAETPITGNSTNATAKIAAKVGETQDFIYIGVILIIIAGIATFIARLALKKS